MTTITIPPRFYYDTAYCDCFAHEHVVETKGKRITVTLPADDLAELLDRAKHYVDMGVDAFGPEHLGLISSARATINAIKKQEAAA